MKTAELAAAVLRWGEEPVGPPPQGELTETHTLLNPPAHVCQVLAGSAARLTAQHMQNPCEAGAAGIATLVPAAVVALRNQPRLAEYLLESLVGTRTTMADELIIEELLRAAHHYLPDELAEALQPHSPLTALFTSPRPDQQAAARARARVLQRTPSGRRLLCRRLGQPASEESVLNWRGDLMERWRLGGSRLADLVLDIYGYAFSEHETEVKTGLGLAAAVLRYPFAASDKQLRHALALARWWKPLFGFSRTRPEALRRSYHLPYTYRAGIYLYQQAARLPGVNL